MYTIEFTQEARKDLAKLTKETQIRVSAALDRIMIRPHAHVVRLVGSPHYRLRVGAYRIIIDIRQETLLILVIEIGHRKDIYK